MQKKVPLRQCLGCREMKPKQELIRIVKSPEEKISLDPDGKNPGRGAYICKDINCLKRAEKAKAFSRAFKAQIPDNIIEELKEQLEDPNGS